MTCMFVMHGCNSINSSPGLELYYTFVNWSSVIGLYSVFAI